MSSTASTSSSPFYTPVSSAAQRLYRRQRRPQPILWMALLPPLLVGAAILALFIHGPIGQPQDYHGFADQRSLGGIVCGADVWSNLGFALVGLWGLARLFPARRQAQIARGWPGYALFLLALIGTAAGSAYYHAAPDDFRLVWDRLPIALACAGLLAAVRCETSPSRFRHESWAAAVALAIVAILSVAWWHISNVFGEDDLRPYLLLQCLPLVLIPLWQKAYHAPAADRRAFLAAIVCYVLAKGAELADHFLFEHLQAISGHTLKHLLATLAAALIVWRLTGRLAKRDASR